MELANLESFPSFNEFISAFFNFSPEDKILNIKESSSSPYLSVSVDKFSNEGV